MEIFELDNGTIIVNDGDTKFFPDVFEVNLKLAEVLWNLRTKRGEYNG